ncbi:MAG: hypothetical protein QF463_03660 [Vicinamibacterales bacterium]|nr:hypothetical protein [Vicinamibacterales bacterium]MDP6608141.1 hypothetical protein [Vicinamibacterales bacterium]
MPPTLMLTLRMTQAGAIAAIVAGLLAPDPALAQSPEGGGFVVERIETGFAVTPDFKFTEFDGRSARLAGVYGGWVNDDRLLVGGGGYWLTNRESDFSMGYGGVVVEWFAELDGPVDLSVRSLIGGGTATLSDEVGTIEVPVFPGRFGPPLGRGNLRPEPRTRTIDVGRVVRYDTFFVAEPQINALLRLTDWLRVSVGAGYRLTGATDVLGDRIRGLTGTVGFQFGL